MKNKLEKMPVISAVAEMPADFAPAPLEAPAEPQSALKNEPSWSSSGSEAYSLYLREIGQTVLLTPAEEVELAKRIKKGDRKAREQMIKANLRLVVKIARDYENLGIPLLDLISEGNIGLMRAVDRFDPSKGAKVSTYAAWWIKQAMHRALANQSRTIRLPIHVGAKLWLIRKAQALLLGRNGREPTNLELGKELHLTARRVGVYLSASHPPSSLDAPLADNQTHTLSEIVPDESGRNPYQELEQKTEVGMVQEMIKGLNLRERSILKARFGLEEADAQTLEEIGQGMGVTRERVRQIQQMALIKLRRQIEQLQTDQQVTA
jgi:RNA polymerase primary sigma factor